MMVVVCCRYIKLQEVGNVHKINLITPEQYVAGTHLLVDGFFD